MRWDRERLLEIVCVNEDWGDGADAICELIAGVRAEAIGWTWTEACSQYDKGLDVRHQIMPDLLDRAVLDLNPERE